MCWTDSQILVVSGLALEFLSVLIALRKLFWGKAQRIDDKIMTGRQRTWSNRVEGTLTLVLLIAGVILQGLSVFL